jgi:hypothetical protein
VAIPAVEAGLQRGTLIKQSAESSLQSKEVPLATMQRHVGSTFFASSAVKTSQIRNLNGTNGMNTPCWEAGGWTALVGGNPTERIGRSRVNDVAGGLGSRLGRSVVAVECGGRRRDTNLKSHVQHPVQKQVRPVPNRRLEQRSCIRRRHLFEGVVVIVPAPGMANRKHSTDRTFRLVHVHNVRRRHHRHDVGDAVKNRLTNLRR